MEPSWQDCARRGLVGDDGRLRLQVYSTLSNKCSESKEAQREVGQLLGDSSHDIVRRYAATPLLNVLFGDLQSTDRTLRVAAARVLCLVTYENLANQHMIMQFQVDGDDDQAGVSVGWVHAFYIPSLLRGRYEEHCEDHDEISSREGLSEYVSKTIKDNYAQVYSRISRYYDGGCQEFLPLCWFYALADGSSEMIDIVDIPDPSENILGFYLVPRQVQFLEQDDFFLQDMLASIRKEDELSHLQQVYSTFQQLAALTPTNEVRAKSLKVALEGYTQQNQARREDDTLYWLGSSPERVIAWNELLSRCCCDLNAHEMINQFGAETYRAVHYAFCKLTLGGGKDQMKAHVWEAAFIPTLLSHPNLPDELKTSFRKFSNRYRDKSKIHRARTEGHLVAKTSCSGLSIDELFDRPWDHLLAFDLVEIHPISWSVFLGKWREISETKGENEADTKVYHKAVKRHSMEATNPSLLTARKNALVNTASHRIFHSFRDLKQLQQQLPMIAYRAGENPDDPEDLPPGRIRRMLPQVSEEEKRDWLEKRKHFYRLRKSSTNLDELTRKQIEDKQAARSKAHRDAVSSRKRSELVAEQRRKELEREHLVRQAKVQVHLQRRDKRWRMYLNVRDERHNRAQRWKLAQQESDVARQDEYLQQLQQQKSQHESFLRNAMMQSPRPPLSARSASADERPSPAPRRPQSARSRTSSDPVFNRERALIYGCAASNAFTVRRPQSSQPKSPASSRRSSLASRQTKGKESKDSNTPAATETNNESRPAGFVNACETLVMTNAAHSVSGLIAIPPVAFPLPEEELVPPAVIMAQYAALNEDQQQKLHERFRVNRSISHKLTLTVLQQLTHEMRQDEAWREFLKATGGPSTSNSKKNKSKREAKVTHAAFVAVAGQLGITMPPKQLQAVARSLDPWKTGFVAWEPFFSWWSKQ